MNKQRKVAVVRGDHLHHLVLVWAKRGHAVDNSHHCRRQLSCTGLGEEWGVVSGQFKTLEFSAVAHGTC